MKLSQLADRQCFHSVYRVRGNQDLERGITLDQLTVSWDNLLIKQDINE